MTRSSQRPSRGWAAHLSCPGSPPYAIRPRSEAARRGLETPRFLVVTPVVEATAYYEWLVELIEPLAEPVVLATPKKLRVIAESTKKTDQLVARILAEFLARDM